MSFRHRLLFDVEDQPQELPPIAGLSYLTGYITPSEEQALAEAIDAESWNTAWERRRQLYGGAYGSGDEAIRPIPAWGLKLAERMHQDGLSPRPFDQMLINEYLPGQGIAPHVDYEPYDRTVASLSLLSPCLMDFRHLVDGQRYSLLLAPRSLLILHDEARYDWTHGIARRQSDVWRGNKLRRSRRLSVTFRLQKRPAAKAP